jgi:hypothetical protein
MRRFAAEVLFLNPADVPRAAEALIEAGCDFEVDHDAIDEHGPTVFGFVTGVTELAENDTSGRSGAMWWSGASASRGRLGNDR